MKAEHMAAFDNFRKHINGLIAEKKVSIMGLSRETGIARNLIYGYLDDGKDLDISRAEKIATAVGASLADLLKEERPATAPPRKPTPEEFCIAFLENYKLDPKRKRIALLALTAKPNIINLMHDTLLTAAFEETEGRAADHDEPSVG